MNQLAELRQKLATAKLEGAAFVAEGKVEEARAKKEEVRTLVEQIELAEGFEQEERSGVEEKMEHRKVEDTPQVEERMVFAKALQGKPMNAEEQRALSGLTGQDGGVLIPADVQTKINEFKRELKGIRQYVNVEPVNTRSGSRVIEKLEDMTPFADLTELDSIAEMPQPKFTTIPFNIRDYAGLMKISNTLLSDSPESILGYISKWIGKKSVVSENLVVFNLLNTAYTTKKDITVGKEVNDVKAILNKDLDPAIAADAKIFTNQDGFQVLDSLTYTDGKPVLQPDATNPTVKRLLGKEVVVFSSKHLPTTGTTTKKAPFIVGSLTETVTLFDRQQLEMLSTNIGNGAFETNTTALRVITRYDTRIVDADATVYAQLTV